MALAKPISGTTRGGDKISGVRTDLQAAVLFN
jgi:hypothetical protein